MDPSSHPGVTAPDQEIIGLETPGCMELNTVKAGNCVSLQTLKITLVAQ